VRKLIFAMQSSLDGYIEGPAGELDWNRIDEQLHRHFNELEQATDVVLYGRRLYELMAGYWPHASDDTSLPDYEREYADIWREKPKVVFSGTLRTVDWNARLVSTDAVEEVGRLKEQGDGIMSVGGATLAGALIGAGLVDEAWVYLTPVTLGGGKPMFGPQTAGRQWRLTTTQQFDSGVTLLRYAAAPTPAARSTATD
jgi:dihydrofolate reductase